MYISSVLAHTYLAGAEGDATTTLGTPWDPRLQRLHRINIIFIIFSTQLTITIFIPSGWRFVTFVTRVCVRVC